VCVFAGSLLAASAADLRCQTVADSEGMKKDDVKKKAKDEQRAALAGWEDEGGAAPSGEGLMAETRRQESAERAGRRAASDATHDSSARGEHRYPDSQQTDAEQKARHDRDDVKRKLGGTRDLARRSR
jgi:hypothetical protein